MFDLIRKILQTKTVTKTRLFDEAPARFRGKPIFSSTDCNGCGVCATSCPARAIDFHKTDDSITLSISYANCIFCGICAEACETNMINITNEYKLSTKDKESLTNSITIPVKAKELLTAGRGDR